MPMTLRAAAQRTSRSVTTLRRYIRCGRLPAQKQPGRFGPEYMVSEEDLANAGLELVPLEEPGSLVRRAGTSIRRRSSSLPVPLENRPAESVPISLFQELQMKHEQLLVQYGMFRASGMRVLSLRAELEARQDELNQSNARLADLRRQSSRETARLKQLLRGVELEQEGRGLEVAALREKVRALELLTRNTATNESIERQFSDVMTQMRRVDSLNQKSSGPEEPEEPRWPDPRQETDH
jgi:hypothetical protein